MLDRKSKFLFAMLAVCIFLTVAATYYNTIILHNFEIIDDLDEAESEE